MALNSLSFSLSKMSDDESDKVTHKLKSREEFTGWNKKVRLVCMSKGDIDGIFGDSGGDPAVGYQSYPVGAQGNILRTTWNTLAQKLVGKVGNTITNSSLQRVWTDELMRVNQAAAEKPTSVDVGAPSWV